MDAGLRNQEGCNLIIVLLRVFMQSTQCKKCRREGKKLFLKGQRCYGVKCASVKRNYPPGIHGSKGQKKLTEFGKQLREKQQVKLIYGISEKQLRNYYKYTIRKKGETGGYILELLEMRLDNVIFRLGLAASRRFARQLVSHGFFNLNKRKANIASMQVKVNDIISIKKVQSKIFDNFEKKLDLSLLPSWITFDLKSKEAKITGKPTIEEVNPPFNIKAIVEYYSRL